MLVYIMFLCLFKPKAKGQCIIGPTIANQCLNDSKLFSISSPTAGYAYTWSVNGASMLVNNNGSYVGNSIQIFANNVGNYTVTAVGTNTSNTTTQLCTKVITVVSAPFPVVQSSVEVGCTVIIGEGETNIAEDPNGCQQVCKKSEVSYTASNANTSAGNLTGNTYLWTCTGGILSATTGAVVVVNWDATIGVGSLTCVVTNQAGCSSTFTNCVRRIESPRADFTTNLPTIGNTVTICNGQPVSFTDLSTPNVISGNTTGTITSYLWNFGDGTYSSVQNPPPHLYASGGIYDVTLTVSNDCNCSSTAKLVIIVNDKPGPTIFCNEVVCAGSFGTYQTSQVCSPYDWSVTSGIIYVDGIPHGTSFSGTHNTDNTIQVLWNVGIPTGFGTVTLDGTNCTGSCNNSTTISIPVIGYTATPASALQSACINQTIKISMPAWPATNFVWTIDQSAIPTPHGIIVSPLNNDNFIYYNTESVPEAVNIACTFYNTLTGCSGVQKFKLFVSSASTLNVPAKICTSGNQTTPIIATVNIPSGGASGLVDFIVTSPSNIQTTIAGIATSATSYGASLPANLFATTGIYNISCVSSNHSFCEPDAQTITVVAPPATPTIINGPDVICPGLQSNTYSSNTVVNSNLVWSSDVGASPNLPITGNQVSIAWNATPTPRSLAVVRTFNDVPGCQSNAAIKVINNTCTDATFSRLPATPVVPISDPVCEDVAYTYAINFACTTAGFATGSPNNYVWEIIPNNLGSIISGQGTNNVTIAWNHIAGAANVTAIVRCKVTQCGMASNYQFTQNIVKLPFINDVTIPTGTTPITICSGEPTAYTATVATTTGSPSEYLFNWGDGTPVTTVLSSAYTAASTHTYINLGINNLVRNLLVRVKSSCTGAWSPDFAVIINVKPQPNLSLTYTGDIQPCIGSTATITLQAASNVISSFVWTSSNPATLGTAAAQAVSNLANNYSCTATYNGCTSTAGPITVAPFACNPPGGNSGIPCVPIGPYGITSITGNLGGCGTGNATAVVVGASTINTHIWKITPTTGVTAIGAGSVTNSPNYTFANPGSYTIQLDAFYASVPASCGDTKISATTTLVIPVIPKMLSGVYCNASNTGYDVKLEDLSAVAAGSIVQSRVWLIDNIATSPQLISIYIHTAVLNPGMHSVALVVTVDGQTCTTATQQIAIPTLPIAAFTITKASTAPSAATESCEDQALQFVNGSSGGGYRWSWDEPLTIGFTTPNSSLANPFIHSPKIITLALDYIFNYQLTVTDAAGCIATTSHSVTIYNNEMNVGTGNYLNRYSVTPTSIQCLGNTATIALSTASSSVPTGFDNPDYTYQWYNTSISNPYEVPGLATTYTNIATVTSHSGSYFVQVTDAKLCTKIMAEGPKNVTFIIPPVAYISGKPAICSPADVLLTANVGVLPTGVTATYNWVRQPGSMTFSGASIADYNPVPGVYTYSLEVSYSDGTTALCSSQSTYSVVVHATADVPIIATPIFVSCSPYSITLSASSTSTLAATYNWSNGALGATITVFNGGLYKVNYTNQYGCKSNSNVMVEPNPASYLWRMPSGCANYCDAEMPKFIDGPTNASFASWEWLKDGTTVPVNGSYDTHGIGYSDPLWLDIPPNGSGSGNYQWATTSTIYGNACQQISPDWQVNINKCCGIGIKNLQETCNPNAIQVDGNMGFEIGLDLEATYNNPTCTAPITYNYSIVNQNGNPVGVVSINPAVTPNTLTNGIATPLQFGLQTYTTNPLGQLFIRITATCNGITCTGVMPYTIGCGGNKLAQNAVGNNTKQSKIVPNLSIKPNPANTSIQVDITNTHVQKTPLDVQVYDALGRQVYSATIAGNSATIPTYNLPNGQYVIQVLSTTDASIRYYQTISIIH